MKGKLVIHFLSIVILMVVIIFACRKAGSSSNTDPQQPNDTTFIQSQGKNCSAPDYGDTLIYPKYKGPQNDYTIKPKNQASGGMYCAWPEGLVIDSTDGTINVTQSETGVRYNVGFVKNGSHDTCVSLLVLAGVTYADSIYVLANNDTLAIPYYNGNPATPPVCDGSDDTDYPGNSGGGHGNNKCQFDVDPPPGQKANDAKVRVRTISGIINLKKTVQDGAFGAQPVSGSNKMVDVYYRLNDNSGKALQKIKVQLWYYEKASDVPAQLRTQIAAQRNNFFTYRVVNGRPRPPQIVITHLAN